MLLLVLRRSLAEDDDEEAASNVVTYEQYIKLTDYLKQKENPALLPMYQTLNTNKIDTNAKTVAMIANEIKQL